MFKNLKKLNSHEYKLYNKILFFSRNKLFYTRLGLADTFQNRINLIFIHIAFLLIKIKHNNTDPVYIKFYQKMFDFIFKQIEINMREIGYGDMKVSNNMKLLVKLFYNILLNCEIYKNKTVKGKKSFLFKHLSKNNNNKYALNNDLVEYFDKYQVFCLDLSFDKVLKGDLNFIYK